MAWTGQLGEQEQPLALIMVEVCTNDITEAQTLARGLVVMVVGGRSSLREGEGALCTGTPRARKGSCPNSRLPRTRYSVPRPLPALSLRTIHPRAMAHGPSCSYAHRESVTVTAPCSRCSKSLRPIMIIPCNHLLTATSPI